MSAMMDNHTPKTEKDFVIEAIMMSFVSDFENIMCKTLSVSQLPANDVIQKFTSLQLEEQALAILITALSNRKLELSCRLINLIEKEQFHFELISAVIDNLSIQGEVIDNAVAYADTLYNSKLVNFPQSYIKVLHSLDEEGSSFNDFTDESDSGSEGNSA